MKKDRKPATISGVHQSMPSEERLLLEEERLAEAVLRRTKLLSEISAHRRQGKKPGADPDLEKSLWRIWERVLSREGFGQHRHWRGFLAQTNSLAYAQADQGAAADQQAWTLRPVAAAKPVQLHGPSDVFASRVITFWAAVGNAQATLHQPALNDGLIELIKALNQAGAGLSWDNEAVIHRMRKIHALELEQKTIHVGQHRSTLALMLALALGRPGVVKFSGSGALNMYSLKPWQSLCAQLGARLHQLNPHAPGLPVRLESSGQARQIHLDRGTPPEISWALLAAAPFYPDGLRLTWPEDFAAGHDLKTLIHLIHSCQVPVAKLERGIHVHPASPVIPEQPEISLDLGLCSLLMAWSRCSNQSITVLGAWPEDAPGARRYIDILGSCGLKIALDRRSLTATPGNWPANPTFDVRQLPQALPLAMLLALIAPQDSIVVSELDFLEIEIMTGLLRFTGRTCERDGQRHLFRNRGQTPDRSASGLEAPDAFWGMGLSLLSFAYPGLSLSNPGELTTLWPRFWQIFQTALSVSKPKPEPQPMENADGQPRSQHRRVRI